jgi:hypothetical protein
MSFAKVSEKNVNLYENWGGASCDTLRTRTRKASWS